MSTKIKMYLLRTQNNNVLLVASLLVSQILVNLSTFPQQVSAIFDVDYQTIFHPIDGRINDAVRNEQEDYSENEHFTGEAFYVIDNSRSMENSFDGNPVRIAWGRRFGTIKKIDGNHLDGSVTLLPYLKKEKNKSRWQEAVYNTLAIAEYNAYRGVRATYVLLDDKSKVENVNFVVIDPSDASLSGEVENSLEDYVDGKMKILKQKIANFDDSATSTPDPVTPTLPTDAPKQSNRMRDALKWINERISARSNKSWGKPRSITLGLIIGGSNTVDDEYNNTINSYPEQLWEFIHQRGRDYVHKKSPNKSGLEITSF